MAKFSIRGLLRATQGCGARLAKYALNSAENKASSSTGQFPVRA